MNLRIINKRSKPPRIILPKASSADAKSEQQDAQKPLELDAGEDVIEKNFYVQSGLAFYRKNGQRSEESSNIDRVKVQWQFEAEQLGASTSSSSRDVEQVMLPGISDSYESYPCPNCSEEKLFMTRAGLEKHASAQHPREFEEISNLANQIQKEWERRKLAKNKATNLQQESEYWKTKAVEMQHQVACHFCDSILPGEAELDLHIASCHYNIPVEQAQIPGNHRLHCHLCWKPCYNIYHLNSHKLSMHGIEAGDATAHHTATTMSQFSIDQNRVVQVASTQCQLCGLIMLRPSLLLRHMVRVHNCHTNFSAKVDYPLVSTDTLPSINYRVDTDGRLVWQCCQQEFKNKETLLAHRASAHPIVEPETVQAERESEILRQLLPRQQNQEHSNSFSMSAMEMGTESFLGIDDFSLLAFQSPLLPSNFDTGTMTHHGEDHDLFAGLEE